eukprot:262130-Chlamydomonas_euryale.AAC.1
MRGKGGMKDAGKGGNDACGESGERNFSWPRCVDAGRKPWKWGDCQNSTRLQPSTPPLPNLPAYTNVQACVHAFRFLMGLPGGWG